MESFFLVIPLFLVLVTVLFGILQALAKSWLDYRFRLAFLDKVEKNPTLLSTNTDLGTVVDSLTTTSPGAIQRQNYRLTGLFLAIFGVACAIGGRLLRSGEVAVGVYLAGVFCLVIGLVIALLGFIIHVMTRPAKTAQSVKN